MTASTIRRSRTSTPPRAAFSDASLAAVVVRSSITAITTISMPGDERAADVVADQRLEDGLAEAGTVDVRRDGRHRERGHDRLVEARRRWSP